MSLIHAMQARGQEVSFGSWLKAKRTEMGLTLEELGERLGMSHVTISRYETGKRLPQRASDINQIAEGLLPEGSTEEQIRQIGIEARAAAAGLDLSELQQVGGKVVKAFDPDDPRLRWLAASDELGLEWSEDMTDLAEKALERKYRNKADIVGKQPGAD